MTDQLKTEDLQREAWLRKIDAMLAKADDPSCTEEERASFSAGAMRLMEKHAIEQHELGNATDKPKKMLRVKLNVKYANGWRVHLCDAVARNCGVFTTFRGKANEITFWGQEHMALGAQLVAEYLVNTVEMLSKSHAKQTGTGTKGRRDFAEGCAYRLCGLVKSASNLSADPRMPAIYAAAREESEAFFKLENGKGARKSSRLGDKRSGVTDSYFEGRDRAESVDLRGHQRAKSIT